MKKPIYAATIGCGRMGAFHSPSVETTAPPFWMPISHLGAIDALENVKAVACCDVSEENREKAKNRFGIPNAYADYNDLLETEKVDLLTIATRTPMKSEIILAALDRGIRAIHVEKPLCNTAEELRNLEARVAETGALITYGCVRRFMPAYKAIRDYTRAAAFGAVQDIHAEMGRVPIMWAQVHAIDQLLFFADGAAPKKVQAWFDGLDMHPDEPNRVMNDPRIISASVLFEGDIIGRIGSASGLGTTVSSATERAEIFADGHQSFLAETPQGEVYAKRRGIESKRNEGPGGSAFPIGLLTRALHGDENSMDEAKVSMKDMFLSQHLIFAMLHSHMCGGRTVNVDSYPKDMGIDGLSGGNPA